MQTFENQRTEHAQDRKHNAGQVPAICRALLLALIATVTVHQAEAEEQPPPATAQAQMQLQAEMLDGAPYSLADSRGSVTVVSVWSPDSLASRKCIGELQRFSSSYRERGVATIAVSTLTDPDVLRQFVAKRNLTVPVALLGNNTLGPLPEQNLPIVYVFDRDGKLQATRAGMFSMRSLERLVAPLVQQ